MTQIIDYGTPPEVLDQVDNNPYELGTRFTVLQTSQLNSLSFWKSALENGSHNLRVWDSGGNLIRTQAVTSEPSSGLISVNLSPPLELTPGEYTVSVNINTGYVLTRDFFVAGAFPVTRDGVITLNQSAGVFGGFGTHPTSSFRSANYFVGGELVLPSSGTPLKMFFVSP